MGPDPRPNGVVETATSLAECPAGYYRVGDGLPRRGGRPVRPEGLTRRVLRRVRGGLPLRPRGRDLALRHRALPEQHARLLPRGGRAARGARGYYALPEGDEHATPPSLPPAARALRARVGARAARAGRARPARTARAGADEPQPWGSARRGTTACAARRSRRRGGDPSQICPPAPSRRPRWRPATPRPAPIGHGHDAHRRRDRAPGRYAYNGVAYDRPAGRYGRSRARRARVHGRARGTSARPHARHGGSARPTACAPAPVAPVAVTPATTRRTRPTRRAVRAGQVAAARRRVLVAGRRRPRDGTGAGRAREPQPLRLAPTRRPRSRTRATRARACRARTTTGTACRST